MRASRLRSYVRAPAALPHAARGGLDFQPDGRAVDPTRAAQRGGRRTGDGSRGRAARNRPRPHRHERASRTLETASIVAPGVEAESWPDLRELEGGRLSEIPPALLEHEFVNAFRGVIPNDARFLRGESIGELFDRVLPALDHLVTDDTWHTALAVLHGAVNRAVLSFALTGERMFLGRFEQAPACVNVLDLGDGGEWIVRAVNVAPYDLLHLAHRQTTMERYWEQYRTLADEA